MIRSVACLLAAATAVACRPTEGARPAADAPSSSAAAAPEPGGKRVTRTFPAAGVSRVVLRATLAREAKVVSEERADILVAGTAQGGAAGYHPSDPSWKETKAEDWGLDFKGKAFGPTLVISSSNELHYIHHSYYLDALVITVPRHVEVTREEKTPTENGAADLRDPSSVRPSPSK